MASTEKPGTITKQAAERIAKIQKARDGGAKTMTEIADKAKLSPSAVRHATWLERHGSAPAPARSAGPAKAAKGKAAAKKATPKSDPRLARRKKAEKARKTKTAATPQA